MNKTLFIDYDGTLHDSDAKYQAKLDGMLGCQGLELWRAYLSVHRTIVHRLYFDQHDDILFNIKLLFEHLRVPYDEKQARELTTKFREAQEECWKNPSFFPDSLPFLEKARSRGYRLYLATGDYALQKAHSVEKTGGRKYFDYAFDQSHLGPKGEISYFRRALALTGCFAEEAVMVGDSLTHDIATAKAVGIETIWVNRVGDLLPKDSPQPDHEVRDLKGALVYLDL